MFSQLFVVGEYSVGGVISESFTAVVFFPRAARSVILKLLEGKLPSQRQFRPKGTTPGMKCHSQAGQNIFFSSFFPGACLWLMHSPPPHTALHPACLTAGENVASCEECSCLELYAEIILLEPFSGISLNKPQPTCERKKIKRQRNHLFPENLWERGM